MKNKNINIFETNNDLTNFKFESIRKNKIKGEWFFSITDVLCNVLETDRGSKRWNELKPRINLPSDFTVQCRAKAEGKRTLIMECANRKTILVILQSINSAKVLPFKFWLAQLAEERVEETENPELGMSRARERAIKIYKQRGMSDTWIESRLRGIDGRNKLTSEWKYRGIEKGHEYAFLTNTLHKGTFGITPKEHKEEKGSKNLRDAMNEVELAAIINAELAARKLGEKKNSYGVQQIKNDVEKAGKIASEFFNKMNDLLDD